MKVLLTTAALALSTIPMFAQAGEQGVSHPDQAPITIDSGDEAAPQKAVVPPPAASTAKPSAYVPYTAPAPQPSAAAMPQPSTSSTSSNRAPLKFDPDNAIVTTDAPRTDDSEYRPYRPYNSNEPATHDSANVDIDANIITNVPVPAGQIPEGTLLKVRMNNALSTKSTMRGSTFTATVTQDVQVHGQVVIPAGSVLDGMVTQIRGGRRISGRAAIHLEPRRVTLPDGTYYPLHAQVIDTSAEDNVRVDDEGTILRRDHAKETVAILSGTTGSAAVAGAMIGGGVGAAVGAGIGAGAGTILWLKQDRQAALPKDTSLVFSLLTPMAMSPLRDGAQLHP